MSATPINPTMQRISDLLDYQVKAATDSACSALTNWHMMRGIEDPEELRKHGDRIGMAMASAIKRINADLLPGPKDH